MITEEEINILRGALDTLGTALVDYNHTWGEGERTIYDMADEILKREIGACEE